MEKRLLRRRFSNRFVVCAKVWATFVLAACLPHHSCRGGMVGLGYSLLTKKGKTDVMMSCQGILAGVISIMAGCANISNLEAVVTGAVGALLAILATRALVWLRVDDPVGASAVHGAAGLWSMVAVGLFATRDDIEVMCGHDIIWGACKLYLYLISMSKLRSCSCHCAEVLRV